MGGIDFDAWRERIRRETFGNYHLQMGLAIEQEGNGAAALEAYRRAMAANPDSLSAHYRAYLLLNRLGRAEEAAAIDRQARAQRPNYQVECQDDMVRGLFEAGSFEEARTLADELLGADGSAARIRLRAEVEAAWGDHLESLQRNGAAAEHFERALSIDPEQPRAHYWAGMQRFTALDLTGAEPHLERTVAGMPEHHWAACMLGFVRLVHGRLDEASRLIAQAAPLLQDAQKPWAHGHLGLTAYMKGDAEGASIDFHRAAALDPKEAWVFCYIGLGLLEQRRHAKAERLFRRSMTLDPNTLIYRAFLGLALFEQGRTEDGLRMVRDTAARETVFAMPIIIQALAEERMGNRDAAQDLYRKAATLQRQFIGHAVRMLAWEAERLKAAFRDIGFSL